MRSHAENRSAVASDSVSRKVLRAGCPRYNEGIGRLQIRILGIVQGVGFRPFVYRLANELELAGWVRNDPEGVTLEVEGEHPRLLNFLQRLQSENPPSSLLYAVDHRFLVPEGYTNFQIIPSQIDGNSRAWILPDLATCSECREEIQSPENRRYRYPFTNCTHCGTRFTIIESLPYDRPRTSMRIFEQCEECRTEYENPIDRRFHAQPNACPKCGPQLLFHCASQAGSDRGEKALLAAEELIRAGKIVALKGLGGFHLIVDARNEEAVAQLRNRKRRQNKPFAVMYPDFGSLEDHVEIPPFARPFLASAQSPILLLRRKAQSYSGIAPSVAPHSPYLGVFLPYTPLHHLLLHDLNFPVVATSGNMTDEPIQFKDQEAFERLGSLCDGFLTHDRPIIHHADDSVIQIIESPAAKPQMLRRARGYTPLPVLADRSLPPLLAVGGHLNVTFALSRDREIILSQHLGDMEGFESRVVYEQSIRNFLDMYRVSPIAIAHDLHPGYFSTEYAKSFGLPLVGVQHHHAHMAACMLENQIEGEVLGITWDGTGYGPDETVWGGEFLFGDARQFKRVASLFPFTLPGGESAIKQTWRLAISLLFHTYGNEFPLDLPLFHHVRESDWKTVLQITPKPQFSPTTSSIGRLFDGASALLGLSYYNMHQAEAAQMLEYAAWRNKAPVDLFAIPVVEEEPWRLDWRPMIRTLVERFRNGQNAEELAAAFHQTLVESAIEMIHRLSDPPVVIAGGVFCNRYLTEALLVRCRQENIKAFIHSQLPPTDGSLAAGQLWVAAHQLQR